MKQFLVKQRFTFGGVKFNIQDNFGQLAYQVKGSFLEIPKRFTVTNDQGIEICQITKKVFSFLPQFTIDMANGHSFFLQKKLTFFKDRYTVESLGLLLEGNIWDLDFRLRTPDGQLVAEISKELFHLTSHYSVTVVDDGYADLVISLVVAIDYVEMMEAASSS
ncbi:TPA: LURP-one-related family protein [Streptococcus suis]|nr:LURP-one-related family protein [Streptococcus suis]HEM3706974.1 LURP-one-related family protein [Streptococcus suis]